MVDCIREFSVQNEEDEKENVCTVTITCKQPKADGSMNVEMSYDGDKELASYLIHSAQGMLEP